MSRIYADYAYGPGPRDGCWWDETIATPDWPVLQGDLTVDVAIIGGGFTGISAALHLAQAGVDVAVLESETPGFGASGRNGGFCCLGGARISEKKLARRFGETDANAYWQAERDAVALVADLLGRHGIDADTHSKGETLLAHRPRDMDTLRKSAEAMAGDPELSPQLIDAADLADHGMNGPFHGALSISIGFALNPRKYLFGLAAAAQNAGARLFQQSRVIRIDSADARHHLVTPKARVTADQVIIATNGYSSDDLPDWLAGRYMPTQSNIIVTRPMSDNELGAQGWTTDQASYDSRNLLHYFRLMPDRRFLFGMRGGLTSTPAAEARARERVRRDFDAMFPAWAHVETPFRWSGMVCLSRNGTPFAGPVPGRPGMFAGLAYHGNGVAMGSYTGKLLTGLIMGQNDVPPPMQKPLSRFPLGRARRALMLPVYLVKGLMDR